MKIKFDDNVRQFTSIFKKNGYEIFAVGGSVRDLLMGIIPNDIDFCTNATPEEMLTIFPHSIKTGIKHGTLTIPFKNKHYEVTTYRIDGEYSDKRHPENVKFSRSLKEDLSRRDFTINAIACDADDGNIIDLFKGVRDIKHKVIRTVGNSKKRFTEDALRMLRCIRFSSQLNFKIKRSALLSIKALYKNIENISKERIREEFFKSITSKYRQRALPLLYKTKLIAAIIPSLNRKIKRKEFKNFYQNLYTNNKDATLCYIFIKLNLSLNNLKSTNIYLKNSNKSAFLSEHLYKSYIYFNKHCTSNDKSAKPSNYIKRKFLSFLTLENFDVFFDSFYPEFKNDYSQFTNQPLTLRDLEINGNDLKNIGINNKDIGDVLSVIFDKVLQDPTINKKDVLIEIAKDYFNGKAANGEN